MIRGFIVALLAAAMALVTGAEPLTAEQNGDQKVRYVVTVDGTNCWSRQVGASENKERAKRHAPD